MFIVLQTNIDHLIDDVRLRVGDHNATSFSDSVIRTALVNSVVQLQHRWDHRYLVYQNSMAVPNEIRHAMGAYYENEYDPLVHTNVTTIIPSGFVFINTGFGYAAVPSGLRENDVFRNPFREFTDTTKSPIAQADEFPIVLQASIILQKAYMASDVSRFSSWSDGQFSYNAITVGKIFQDKLKEDIEALDRFFKQRLAVPVVRRIN